MRKIAKLNYHGLKTPDAQVSLKETSDKFAQMELYLLRKLRDELRDGDKKATGRLIDSYKTETKVKKDDITLTLYGTDYAKYVEKGVQGAQSSDKAPDSPFKFGSGTGPAGGLRPAIRQWILDKPVAQQNWRDEKGRFLSYEQMTSKIVRSVFLTGIEPFPAVEHAFEDAVAEFQNSINAALAADWSAFMNGGDFTNTFEIKIEI